MAPQSTSEPSDLISPVSVVSISTFILRDVGLSLAEEMISLSGRRHSHFGHLLRGFSIIMIGSVTEFCMTMVGSTVSFTEYVGKTEKRL